MMNLPAPRALTPLDPTAAIGTGRAVGFFPGLGSRDAYRDLGRTLLDPPTPGVSALYRRAAEALGRPHQPEALLFLPGNVPTQRLERQGFIGAASLVHGLVLLAHLQASTAARGASLNFIAHTGESLGILTAAVASGALSLRDGTRIARAFTPMLLVAAEGSDGQEPIGREMAAHLPANTRDEACVAEPSHVIALVGNPDDLAELLRDVAAVHPTRDVEVHKLYSRRQRNVYVRTGVKHRFDQLLRRHPGIEARELKAPTTFLAHSARMLAARRGLENFLDAHDIEFHDPQTPVISNHGAGLLTTGDDVRGAVLALADQPMASQTTVETLAELGPDVVIELGPGGRSVQLVEDNDADVPVTAYTGRAVEADAISGDLEVVSHLTAQVRGCDTAGGTEHGLAHDAVRRAFRRAARSRLCDSYLRWTVRRLVRARMADTAAAGTAEPHPLVEILQHTCNHRDAVDVEGGELVLRARRRKRIDGPPHQLGRVDTELRVLGATGGLSDRSVPGADPAEVTLVHFDEMPGTDPVGLVRRVRALQDAVPALRDACDEAMNACGIGVRGTGDPGTGNGGIGDPGAPGAEEATVAARLVYQAALFQALRLRRPALFAQGEHHLEGSDPVGWLAALVAAEAAPAEAARTLGAAHLRTQQGAGELSAALDRFAGHLVPATVPVLSPSGIPSQSASDLARATRAVFLEGALDGAARTAHLGGPVRLIDLGTSLDRTGFDRGPHPVDVVTVAGPLQACARGAHAELDALEDRCLLALTAESEGVRLQARDRRILSSTLAAYVNIDETVVGFGKGGSESMTIFVRRDGEEDVVVRKILSEALTTARWDPNGEGVMLPPFTKAKKQAEFLQALPESVRGHFPRVGAVLERSIPAPGGGAAKGGTPRREVIYEMSYVPGEEVSRFVERHCPPPAVIARLYEQILRVLHSLVHDVAQAPAPGGTLEASYFRKIEDRLDLCRRTAPKTFAPVLLDTERITINGVSYLNHTALLRRFRENPEFLAVLEPRVHSLVMGDTNTENIKMADTRPLLEAQRLIEDGAPAEQVEAALARITPESLGIAFLDPRAIGFESDGAQTRDDPMYDNKPWHNSIGHYDEIHHENFSLRVRTGLGTTPRVDIDFDPGNPYQRAYRVRDVSVSGKTVSGPGELRGMEDYFAPVMTAVYGLDDPRCRQLQEDPHWLIRFAFVMGSHFTAMPPFHFHAELDGTLTDTPQVQRRPVAIYCEGIKWLNWALEMLEGTRTEFLGLPVPPPPHAARAGEPVVLPKPRRAARQVAATAPAHTDDRT